jgi:hypothetical protein
VSGRNKNPNRRSNDELMVPEHDRSSGELTDNRRLSEELTDQHRSSGELTEQVKHMDYIEGLPIIKINNAKDSDEHAELAKGHCTRVFGHAFQTQIGALAKYSQIRMPGRAPPPPGRAGR